VRIQDEVVDGHAINQYYLVLPPATIPIHIDMDERAIMRSIGRLIQRRDA